MTHSSGPYISEPYISVVVAARNDNHGGNMLRRMQAFLNAWIGQASRYNLPSEIIVVEWNPPTDRPKLIDCLEIPANPGPCELRFVEVPGGVHRKLPNPDAIPLHQMLAKNVGIRRARGKFVLVTNIDIVFSAELMRFLAERRLEQRTVYRTDRHDVSSEIPEPAGLDELLDFCHRNMRRVFTAEGDFERAPNGLRKLEEEDVTAPGEGIRFGAGWYSVERYEKEPFRWMAAEAEIIFERPHDAESVLLMDVDAGPSARGAVLSVEVVDRDGSVLAAATIRGRAKLRLNLPKHISTGSFRLRLGADWVALLHDVRFLMLRLFKIWWERSMWLPEHSVATLAARRAGAGIRVRSLDPSRLQLTLLPGEGANLDNLEVSLSDPQGNVLFRVASDRLQPAQSGEYLLAVDLGFKFAGQRDSTEFTAPETQPPWFLEVIATRPATNWAVTRETPSPFTDQMCNPAYLHVNACGDFTLLAREDWWSLRGYAELPIWPVHIDSLLCYAAHHAGMRELVLLEPMRIFHIEHLSGAGWTPEGEQERRSRIESKGVTVLQYQDLMNWIDRMRRFNAPAIFTLSGWGLAGEDLPETVVNGARVRAG
jgi:hypothetical protein